MSSLILPAIHLGVLLGFIFYKVRSPFGQYLKERYESTVNALESSKKQAALLDSKKKEVELRFAQLESEKKKVFESWKAQEEGQVKAIRESSVRVLEQMKKDAEMSRAGLETAVRAEAIKTLAEHTIVLAEEKIKQKLNADVQKRLQDKFVLEVSKV